MKVHRGSLLKSAKMLEKGDCYWVGVDLELIITMSISSPVQPKEILKVSWHLRMQWQAFLYIWIPMIEHLGYKYISDASASSPGFISQATMVSDVPAPFRSWWNCWRTCTSGKVTNPYFLLSLIERSLGIKTTSGRRMNGFLSMSPWVYASFCLPEVHDTQGRGILWTDWMGSWFSPFHLT